MKLVLALGALLLSVFAASAEQASFEGFKVWLVSAERGQQLEDLAQWQQRETVDFWEPPGGQQVRIMVAPDTQKEFADFLESNNIKNELIIDNVERTLEKEREYDNNYRLQKLLAPLQPRLNADFNNFWSLEEVADYIALLAREHPDLVSTEIIGNSTEGRPLYLVNVSLNGRGTVTGSRPIIFIDAGIHAREWVAHHAGLYILSQLVENRQQYRRLLEDLDFVILPVVNPDGYQYTRDSERFWRKTRTPFEVNDIGRICYGVDGNRNYAHYWRSALESNVNTCHETYPGTAPFSEPETQAVKFVLDRHGRDIKIYISIHTYGNYVLYPWGFDREYIENWQLHEWIGRQFSNSIFRATGTRYIVGNSAIELYPAYGASDDYAAHAGVEAAFTFELPGGGRYGFDYPADQLQSVLAETWIGFRSVFDFASHHRWLH